MDVTICDVGPRDGLQNEPETLEPAVRGELVSRLAAAGVPRIEAVSFVRADRVPQMAGAEEVVAAADRGGAELSGLADVGTGRTPGEHAPRRDAHEPGEAEEEDVGIEVVVQRGADKGAGDAGEAEHHTGADPDPTGPPVGAHADERG